MAERNHGQDHGSLNFRFHYLDEGKLRVWYRFEESPEIGPVELDQSAADALGVLIEKAADLVQSAIAATARSEPELVDDEPTRAHTDPFALRHKRRPDADES